MNKTLKKFSTRAVWNPYWHVPNSERSLIFLEEGKYELWSIICTYSWEWDKYVDHSWANRKSIKNSLHTHHFNYVSQQWVLLNVFYNKFLLMWYEKGN